MARLSHLTALCVLSCVLVMNVSTSAQDWDPNKVYQAETDGIPNSLRFIDNNGAGFPGWVPGDTKGTITNEAPDQHPPIDGLYGNFFEVIAGKEKHRTTNWILDSNSTTRTAVFWKLYVDSPVDRFPAVQIRTHNWKHYLDFKPDVLDGGGDARSGWVPAEGGRIIAGGKLIPDGSGASYLPMTMNEWHTIRMEVAGNNQYEAWIDEEEGLSDVKHVLLEATEDGSGDYIEIGVRSSDYTSRYWTNYLAFGQDTTATGGTNEIAPLPDVPMEICSNGLDDDGDGLADCDDPGCLCDQPKPESGFDACSNGLDDDRDGLYDCADPDCNSVEHCGETQPHFVLTLARQIGHWQNANNTGIYFSVYDENGNPLNNVTLKDPLNFVSETTRDPDGTGDQQGGHIRHIPWDGLKPTAYQFYVSSNDDGSVVSSDVTPVMYANLPPDYERSAWQIEFMRVPERRDTPICTPTEPTYIFDAVDLNVPPGDNPTLDNDLSGLGDGDFGVGGAGILVGQTFTANCNRIVSARVEATVGFHATFQYQLSVHELLNNPPASQADIGPQIGPTRQGPPNMFDSEFWSQMILWPLEGPDAVSVTPGQAYFLKITRADLPNDEMNVFVTTPDDDYYANGMQFRQPLIGPFRNDHPNYDVVGYVIGATSIPPDPCRGHDPVFDTNDDQYVNHLDFVVFQECATGPVPATGVFDALSVECQCMDMNEDQAIDQQDFGTFQMCFSGDAVTADPDCDG